MALLTADDNDDDEEDEIIEETDSDHGMYGNVSKYRFARFENFYKQHYYLVMFMLVCWLKKTNRNCPQYKSPR